MRAKGLGFCFFRASAHLDLRQQVSECADGGGLPGPAVPHDHHTADLRVNHVQDERQLHLFLAHNGSEGVHRPGGPWGKRGRGFKGLGVWGGRVLAVKGYTGRSLGEGGGRGSRV